jgi:hypothetical protein
MNASDAVAVTARDRHRRLWQTYALLTLGTWLVVSPYALGTAQVTAGAVSAMTSGLALIVLSDWLRLARNRVPPLLLTLAVGGWPLLVPSLWEFADGRDAWPLVPIPPSGVIEPTRAIVARAEWNSILAGLLTLALAGSVILVSSRLKRRRPESIAREERQRQGEAPDVRR